ncbi:MAG: universal stress protein [Candidatus Bathyarchaeota archaeon]|nr:universal stress protein [Candidatus Bathyarchaeota archaeon]
MNGDVSRLFRKILVPLDGSQHSLKALSFAVEIAKKFGGKITLVHVYSSVVVPTFLPKPSVTTGHMPIMAAEDVTKVALASRRVGRRILEDGEEKARAEKVDVESLLREGHTVEEITRVAEGGRFELIVMGARGVSHVRAMFLGSASDGVIHHAGCPVLVVK